MAILWQKQKKSRQFRIKFRYIPLCVLIFLVSATVIYTVWDNNRVIVEEQDIYLDNLPEEFDGYVILQISDLHSKYFGEKQECLISLINSLEFDCIMFTGDMNKNVEGEYTETSKAFLELVENIENKKNMIWVDGNTDVPAILLVEGFSTGRLTPVGENLEQMGICVLTEPVAVEKNGQKIWFVPDMMVETSLTTMYEPATLNMMGISEKMDEYEEIVSYGETLKRWHEYFKNVDEVMIRIDHYPLQTNLTEDEWHSCGFPDYDLSISGHYHGGQIRLPFIGALYIPSPTSGVNNGYFPEQKEVKGLDKFLNTQQYISAGLGSSATIPFLDFRLFNTPEINLLTLKCSDGR